MVWICEKCFLEWHSLINDVSEMLLYRVFDKGDVLLQLALEKRLDGLWLVARDCELYLGFFGWCLVWFKRWLLWRGIAYDDLRRRLGDSKCFMRTLGRLNLWQYILIILALNCQFIIDFFDFVHHLPQLLLLPLNDPHQLSLLLLIMAFQSIIMLSLHVLCLRLPDTVHMPLQVPNLGLRWIWLLGLNKLLIRGWDLSKLENLTLLREIPHIHGQRLLTFVHGTP